MWRELLAQAVGASSRTQVGKVLGYSTTTISLVMNGKYPGGTDKIAARVMDVFGKLHCPYTDTVISRAECNEIACQSAPTNNPARLRHWKACQNCTNKQQCGGNRHE